MTYFDFLTLVLDFFFFMVRAGLFFVRHRSRGGITISGLLGNLLLDGLNLVEFGEAIGLGGPPEFTN